ncbi:helicase-related protein, partial [Flavobacterium sp. A45]|uniref:helicase-related protein n=1 Tax=Flavobacterium sp. A45 TaxID=1945862 RepID=UPI0009C62C1F
IYTPNKEAFDRTTHHKKRGYLEALEERENKLFELLLNNRYEQSIIYCSSPNRVRDLSKRFLNYIVKNGIESNSVELDINEWIKNNISTDWSLINLLNHKIGIHDGALQKHITSSIINYFNDGKLNFLFCTTTIIEGVNTSAKNIIFYDSKKGRDIPIDFFDYSNIKGRAGRLMMHYTGNIYNFNPIPTDTQITIDIPFYEQNPISNEVLITLSDDEVLNKETDQYKAIKNIPFNEKEIIKNNAVEVFGQKNIIDKIRRDINANYNLISWTQTPTYRELEYCLKLGWDHLMKDTESKSLGIGRLINKTFNYGMHQNMAQLIQSDLTYINECVQYYDEKNNNPEQEGINKNKFSYGKRYSEISDIEIKEEVIMSNFQIHKHWFQYKIPKWLSVINSIQTFVCNEKGLRPGNYSHYTNLIENEFLRENLTILSEFGIPSSAIRKLENLIPANMSQDDVISKIKNERIYDNPIFIEYEKNKLKNN